MRTPDWTRIDLVIFDMDGTLYDPPRLRAAMLLQLLIHAVKNGSLDTLKVLRTFRRLRERLADHPGEDFDLLQYTLTAQRHGKSPEVIRSIVHEWMEERPLPFLRACRVPHVERLFKGLAEAGKSVAVLSDYPARLKLHALELEANLVVCASDPGVMRLKPDPAGILEILKRTGVAPERCLMVGDRSDRDGEAARRAGVQAFIRSRKPCTGFATFESFDDAMFEAVLATPLQSRRVGI
ncbi:MAG: HAD family hydrolase [Pseudomonadota bacterium]